jgi:uncharacterized protein
MERVNPFRGTAHTLWEDMMGVLEDNKALARAFCETYSRGDWGAMADLMTDDWRWKAVTSQRRQSPSLKDAPVLNADPGYGKAETLEIYAMAKGNAVDESFDLTPVSLTAEDDRVAVEARSLAVNKANGRVYDNCYHLLFVCCDGRLAELREYQDTFLVYDVWGAP